MIVVDASMLANAVGDDGADGARARGVLAEQDLSVPELVDVQVVSVLRRRWLAKDMTARRFAAAITDLTALPADRYAVLPFMPRAYGLRATVSAYNATYVALAEQLGCPLTTADARLATAPGRAAPSRCSDRNLRAATTGERPRRRLAWIFVANADYRRPATVRRAGVMSRSQFTQDVAIRRAGPGRT